MIVRVAVATAVIAVAACTDNPSIDGSQVPLLDGSAATCDGVCNRLVALCGYAPEGDVDGGDCTDDNGGGYCDTQMNGYLACFATAGSCQDAWNCFNTVTPDAGGDDSSGDSSVDDGATE